MQLGKLVVLASLPVMLLTLPACTTAPSSKVYSTVEAGTVQEVRFGTIVALRNVIIRQNSTETGKVAGGIIGGVTGSEFGEGKGKIIGSVTGAVVGSAIGSVLDRNLQAKNGLEITVRLQDGRMIAIVQLADQPFQIGDPIKILTGQDGKSRVTH